MADLAVDRISPATPFSYVGLDVFGPWQICALRTRGGLAHSKRWAVLFACMSTRAVHIEVIESMDTSSFINALRRFLAIRGPVIQLRSDCGTNFVGACTKLQAVLKPSDASPVKRFLLKEGCEWLFNPHRRCMGKNDRRGEMSIGSHVSGCLAETPHTRSLNNPDG